MTRIQREPQTRILSRDGKFRVHRHGARDRWDLYHSLLSISWPLFLLLVFLFYLVVNLVFGMAYFAIPGGILSEAPLGFADAFFFSVQTLSTIGYGQMAPHGLAANFIVTFEVILGVMSLAVITGLVFAKFSRPTTRVLFSDVAVVTTFEGKPVFMFRMANERANEIVEASVTVSLWQKELTQEGKKYTRIHEMNFMRNKSQIFALTWTAMHVIDEKSPLYGRSPESEHPFEIIVTLTGIDATFSQPVHTRHSYLSNEIIWNARFVDVLSDLPEGGRSIDLTKFHEVERLEA